ncbi:MBL fold metallo-hydrolase [Terrihabitans sp. B22-R8]|uniref:MBL fold metallo-hydrolase n=1 Tax=Terrihabitans sp. B22-R8 TaxID=3425128 RepID=UPI00403D1EE7
MVEKLSFDRSHPGPYGQAIVLSPLVRRVVANNPGPMTFTGTVTHIVGRGRVAIIDPGPDDGDHLTALLAATAGETISHIVVTHTHRDHIDGVDALRQATGAIIVGCAAKRAGVDEAAYAPALTLDHGDLVEGDGWTLETVATPGHTPEHLAFALRGENALFCGDHVMAWSTSVVLPPEGKMRAYKASLRLLLERDETTYYPAHGASIADAKPYVAALLGHRHDRERQIVGVLRTAPAGVDDIRVALYPNLAPPLTEAARLSILAHIEELRDEGLVEIFPEGASLRYRLT